MKLNSSLKPLIAQLAYWDRRLSCWRNRAQLTLLERELGARLQLATDTVLEPGILWRIGIGGKLSIGDQSVIRTGTELKIDGRLEIGQRVLVGAGCTLSVLEALQIGDDCLLAERVSIRDHDHRFLDPHAPISQQGYRIAPVVLGRNVWIGAGVTLLPGVKLGNGCVVGANAVVTRSFPERCVIAGVPARVLKALPSSESPYVGSD